MAWDPSQLNNREDIFNTGGSQPYVPPETTEPTEPLPPIDTTSTGYQTLLDTVSQFQQTYNTMLQEQQSNRFQYNKEIFQRYSPQFQTLKNSLERYDIEVGWKSDGSQIFFTLPGSGGIQGTKTVGFDDITGYLTGQVETLSGQEQRETEINSFFDRFTGWMTDFQAGTVTVDPFGDPNGWNDMIESIFSDIEDSPDMIELLKSLGEIIDPFEYSADELPNLSAPERMTKFFDDLAAKGFNIDTMQNGLDQGFMDFLYKQAQDLAPRNMFNQLGIDLTSWRQMTGSQVKEIMKVIGRKSMLDDPEIRKYVDAKMTVIKRVNKEEYNRVLATLAARGVGHGGAVIRSVQELATRLGEAEMSTTADIFLKGLEMAEAAKPHAMQQWAQISDTEAELTMQIGGLKSELFGRYFDFLTSVGQVAASQYATRTEAHMTAANLELKYNLGVAGLDLEKYISDRGLDQDQLELDYMNYWRDRGANLDEKQAEFNAAVTRWQTASMMTEMINSGRQDRLVQLASLSFEALSGDREAFNNYQQLALTERLQQRGYDIDQSTALADLMWQRYEFGENMDYQKWATKYDALIRKELLRLNIEGQERLLEKEGQLKDDGFWGSVISAFGGAAKLGMTIFGGGGGAATAGTTPVS